MRGADKVRAVARLYATKSQCATKSHGGGQLPTQLPPNETSCRSALDGFGQRHVLGHVSWIAHRFPDHPNQHPPPGTILVKPRGVDETVKPSLHAVADVAGKLVPAV